MAPGIWLGIGGYMNAVYSALTVPALFLAARRLVGSGWARVTVGIYLTAPMLMIGAATEMSHTSCLFAVAWMGWFLLRSRDEHAPAWSHAGVAAAFGVAFFVRPTSALGAGLPVLVTWLWGLRRLPPARRPVALTAFAAPAAALAVLFLSVNHAQTGSALKPAYLREAEYARENQYRFTNWSVRSGYVENTPVVHFDFGRSWSEHLAYSGLALLRLNFALFGWPGSLLFVVLAPGRGPGLMLTASFVTFCLVHLAVLNPGLDTFGPHHYFELAWPVLLLSALGLARTARGLGQLAARATPYPAALAVALILVSVLQYTPIRLGVIASIAAHVNRARDALAAAGIHRAVVFTPQPFPVRAAGCSWPRHFVGWRPHTDPDLANDVLWVNHVSVEENRKLMDTLPGRRGYVLQWDATCRPRLLPLDGLSPDAVPEAPQARPRQIQKP
jgi:4-amino-4-deoxy-L-arabinose transferase-like glycosyltransferase